MTIKQLLSRSLTNFVVVGATAGLLIVYFVSGPRTLPEADSGELAAIAIGGGIPHPPGYPLLVILLQGFSLLAPLVGLISALTLLSELCAGIAAVLITRTLIARGTSPMAAAAATLAVFLSRNVWRAATSFEPFALNLLLAAAVIAGCDALARASDRRGETCWSVAIGAVFGLGLCNHHSLAMYAPLPLAIVLAERRRILQRLFFMAAGVILGAAPLLSFAWLRTQPGWIWGDWSNLFAQTAHHVLRRDYGTMTLTPGEGGRWGGYGAQRMLVTLPAVLSYAFFTLGVFGAGVECFDRVAFRKENNGKRTDGFAAGLLAVFILSGLFFPSMFPLKGTALDRMITDRFLALPMLPLAFPISRGLSAFRVRPRLAYAAVLALLLAHVAWQWPEAARIRHRFFEAHVRNVFDIMEKNSVVMIVGDGGFSGGLYGKYVLGRDNVTVVITGLGGEWYRKRVAGELAGRALDDLNRPLYLLDIPAAKSALNLRYYPVGPLLRVLLPDARMPAARELFEKNQKLFAKLRLPSRYEIIAADAWEREELQDYERTWQIIGERLQREGDLKRAKEAFACRDFFRPPPE